jgi:tRNA-specific 2-thiouridylase
MKKIRALVLLSGGLDSILTAKLLKESGIETTGLSFKSAFFGTKKAEEAAIQLNIPIKIVDFSKEHLQMLKKPAHGYGSSANPCIDCHLLMLKMAREIMEKENYDFVATGEVLGERPFSQNRQALMEITELSGLKDRLLRPLSARLLPRTLP